MFQALIEGEEQVREAAAMALYDAAQQECFKIAMCRIEGGIEVLLSIQRLSSCPCASPLHPHFCPIIPITHTVPHPPKGRDFCFLNDLYARLRPLPSL